MTRLPDGTYRTAAGSTVQISGKHAGVFYTAIFDWLEEGGCIECTASHIPVRIDGDWCLTWDCEECGGGAARIYSSAVEAEQPNVEEGA
jgi:hypothetical protein